MKRVAVCHPSFSDVGGAESVCFNVLEALSDEYDVTLLTTSRPEVDRLNDYFNTEVAGISVRTLRVPAVAADAFSAVTTRVADVYPHRFREALFKRWVQWTANDYDFVFSTRNEHCIRSVPSAQYVHLPRSGLIYTRGRESLPESQGEPSAYMRQYDRLCAATEGYDRDCIASSNVIANSEWTAALVEDIYGMEPTVVYPPIDKSAFDPQPWEERENGFVMIGKVCKDKRTAQSIRFVDRLREAGYDVHLHIVGPVPDTEYARDVVTSARDREYVHLDGKVARERLVYLICSHRYGFHAMRQEHFGMAVAELASGGAIPFVPNGGGQVYIVDDDRLTYDTLQEATRNARRVLDDSELQRRIQSKLRARAREYGTDAFHTSIRSIVADAL